jgi:hypothetical protein
MDIVETDHPQLGDRVLARYWDGPNTFLYLVARPVV